MVIADTVARFHSQEKQVVVKKLYLVLLLMMFAFVATPALAQGEGEEGGEAPAAQAEEAVGLGLNKLGAGIGAGITLLGVGLGIGRIGGQAVEGMSRQPEAAGNIQTAMIIAAALIEGAGFFALVICLLA